MRGQPGLLAALWHALAWGRHSRHVCSKRRLNAEPQLHPFGCACHLAPFKTGASFSASRRSACGCITLLSCVRMCLLVLENVGRESEAGQIGDGCSRTAQYLIQHTQCCIAAAAPPHHAHTHTGGTSHALLSFAAAAAVAAGTLLTHMSLACRQVHMAHCFWHDTCSVHACVYACVGGYCLLQGRLSHAAQAHSALHCCGLAAHVACILPRCCRGVCSRTGDLRMWLWCQLGMLIRSSLSALLFCVVIAQQTGVQGKGVGTCA